MSSNKSKYFVVTTQTVVRANNKGDAFKASRMARRMPGTEVLSANSAVERITADEAHTVTTSV